MSEANGPTGRGTSRGAIAWMASNSVAANLLMIVLIVGGLIIGSRVKQEVFPEFDLDMVVVNVPYPGASPAEVEQGVILAVEEAVRGLDGVEEIRSTASESVAVVVIELLAEVDPNKALSDIKAAIDRITSFPEDIERPVVSLASTRNEVISLVIHGDLDERTLRRIAEQARDDLLEDDRITLVELEAVRPYEISVEIPQETLRAYNLTLDDVASSIRQASVEMPGGAVKTSGGELLLRTTERRDSGVELADVTVLSRPDGTQVRLVDIATIRDDFAQTDQTALFNGKPAAMVSVYRVGEQTPLDVASAVFAHVDRMRNELPAGVGVTPWNDRSELYRDRMSLLLRNGYVGLSLVLLVLGLFLAPRLAFWVTMGIPISFVGSLLFLQGLDVSINMISLFAFIVTLGIVVDDAIVVGESVYFERQHGKGLLRAAIDGTRAVGIPVVFSVLTTVAAFAPLLFVPGVMGKFFRNIPLVVITVLLMSLIESLFILPAHLAHSRPGASETGVLGWVVRRQRRIADWLERFIRGTYQRMVRTALTHRHVTMAIGTAVLLAAVGYTAGGRIKVAFMPKIDSDRIVATLTLPFGTAIDQTRAVADRMTRAAQGVLAQSGEPDAARGVFTLVGGMASGRGHSSVQSSGTHLAQVSVYLVPSDLREIEAREFSRRWRESVGEVPGAESLTFQFSVGPGATAPIDIELSHRNIETLEGAAGRLAAALGEYSGVVDIDDGFARGKEQLDLQLKPEARALGIREAMLARQVRSAFFGAEAVRQQRGRDEVRTYVRLPEAQRRSEWDVDQLLIRTPQGGELPLGQAAFISRGRSFTQIQRVDGRRTVRVSADVAPGANANEVVASLRASFLPQLLHDVPGLSWAPGGQQKEQREAMQGLGLGFLIALIAIYGLLAVPFRSYVQPVVVMVAIPFGFVGALIGHVLMGYDLSMISMMGLIALSGVVVNDSLVLVVAVNRYRDEGMGVLEAVVAGGMRRFRPIILTSLTTFFGLSPMILESSVQARFLIPMAISLGFGVLFATGICLILVPTAYVISDDARRGLERLRDWWREPVRQP